MGLSGGILLLRTQPRPLQKLNRGGGKRTRAPPPGRNLRNDARVWKMKLVAVQKNNSVQTFMNMVSSKFGRIFDNVTCFLALNLNWTNFFQILTFNVQNQIKLSSTSLKLTQCSLHFLHKKLYISLVSSTSALSK